MRRAQVAFRRAFTCTATEQLDHIKGAMMIKESRENILIGVRVTFTTKSRERYCFAPFTTQCFRALHLQFQMQLTTVSAI